MSPARNRRAILGLAVLAACHGDAPGPGSNASAGSAAASNLPSTAATAGHTSAAAPPATEPLPSVKRYTADLLALDEPKLDLPKQESFRLLDPGTGPRSKLRYALAAGTVTFTTQTQLSSRHLDAGQLAAPSALPAIRDGFAITVTAGAPTRLALRGLPGQAATPSPDADAYLATWRTLLQGRTLTVIVDDRGQASTITFNDDPTNARSAQAKAELVQRLLSTMVPLPTEPVAPGARWRVVTILRQGPAYAKQTATYTLTARTATAWKLHVKLQRVAEEQRITDPALPAGTTADLLALFRNLEGDVDADPAHPLITAGTLTVESRLHVRLTPPAPATGAAPPIEQVFEDTGTATLAHDP